MAQVSFTEDDFVEEPSDNAPGPPTDVLEPKERKAPRFTFGEDDFKEAEPPPGRPQFETTKEFPADLVPEKPGEEVARLEPWKMYGTSPIEFLPPKGKEAARKVLSVLGGGAIGAAADVMQKVAPDTKLGRIAKGVEESQTDMAQFFTSPMGISTLGMGAMPKMAQRAVSLAFSAQMAKDVPEIAKQLGDELGKPENQRDYAKIAQLTASGAQAVGFSAMAGAHGLAPGRPVPPVEQARLVEPPPEAPGPPPVPEYPPVPTEPVPPRPVITPAPEAPTTPGVQNARSFIPPAEVYGDLRPQPGERPGQVPIAEGGSGIQPQAEGRIQEEARPPEPEVPLAKPPAEPFVEAPKKEGEIGHPEKKHDLDMTPEQALDWLKDNDVAKLTPFRGKFGGGMSGWAREVGSKITTPEQLDVLRQLYKAYGEAKDPWKSHVVGEAYEAATGFKLDLKKEPVAIPQKIEGIRKDVPGYEPPMAPKAEPKAKSELQKAWDKFDDTGEIQTFGDLVDEVDAIGDPRMADAVEKYRQDHREDQELAGRGDMEAAESDFEASLKAAISEAPKKAAVEQAAVPTVEKPVVAETDPAKIQQIKNSIREGEMILQSGKSLTGRKMTKAQLGAVAKSVENAKAKLPKPAEAPQQAAAKVQQKVTEVAKTEGARPAKEIKSELVQRLEKAIEQAPNDVDVGQTDKLPDRRTKVTIEIPGDGVFTVWNTKENLSQLLARANKITTGKKAVTAPEAKSKTTFREDADKAVAAYGSAEDAHRSIKRQLDELQKQEPQNREDIDDRNKKIDAAEAVLQELYGKTKAGKLEAQAERARESVETYRTGAEGFREAIAKIEKIKRKTAAHNDRLADLKERYAQNQEFIKTNERNAEQWEQQAAKEKSALESSKPTEETGGKAAVVEETSKAVTAPVISLSHVEQAFPGSKVRETPLKWPGGEQSRGFIVELPNGKTIVVDPSRDTIVFGVESVAKDYGVSNEVAAQWRAGGKYRPDTPNQGILELLKTSDASILSHEKLHAFMDLVFSDAEKKAILDRYGSEEKAAEAFRRYEGFTRGFWDKIKMFVERLGRMVKGDVFGTEKPTFDRSLGITPGAPEFLKSVAEKTGKAIQSAQDYFGIKPIPKLQRAGLGDAAYEHASARSSIVHSVRDFLAKVFPEQYKDPAAMARTMDIINKDNILGGYDEARIRFAAADTPQESQAARAALEAIAATHDIAALNAEVRAAMNDPVISANIGRWKEIVNPEMDRLYNEMKMADPDTPRETRGRHFGARVNLLPNNKAAKMLEFADQSKPMPETSISSYRNPAAKRDPFARKAKFTGTYSNDASLVLTNSLGGRWNEVTKLRFYKAIEDSGAGIILDPGAEGPDMIGRHPAKRLPVEMPETGKDGRTKMVKKTLWVRGDLGREIRDVLGTDQSAPGNPIARFLTTIQLAQLADAVSHIKNIHTVITNSLGASKGWQDAVRKFPFLNSADTVTRIASVASEVAKDTPAIRAEIAGMAKAGLIRPKYPATGLQTITRGQQVIHAVDTASRVVMNRFWDNLVERGAVIDSPAGRRAFVQQIGEYNRRLMGPGMALARDWGLSPFVVAGRNFNRYARRMLTGSPGFEAASGKAAAKARAMQFTGLVTAATLPAIINLFTTGRFGGREGTPIGAIDTGTDNDQNQHRIVDLFQLLGIRRGLRATGIGAVIEGVRREHPANRIVGKAFDDITSTIAHPWLGPGLSAAYSTLTGKRLDLRGGASPYAARNVGGGGKQLAENARVTLKNQNALLYGLVSPLVGEPEESYGESVSKGFLKSPMQSVGYQEQPRSSANSLMQEKARNWLEKSPIPQLQEKAREMAGFERGQVPESSYDGLRHALRRNDLDQARKQLDELLKIREPKVIMQTMRPINKEGLPKPFTGSRTTEKYFVQSLTPEERQQYQAAVRERMEIYFRFRQMLSQTAAKNN